METQTALPGEAQIKDTIQVITKRLKEPGMSKPVNRAIREGYTEVLAILAEDRRTYEGIDALSTLQGRAIAVLGVDYLLGDCTKKLLVGVPLKS